MSTAPAPVEPKSLPVLSFAQYMVDITGLLPTGAARGKPENFRLLLTVIDGAVVEVAPRRASDRGWGAPLPLSKVPALSVVTP